MKFPFRFFPLVALHSFVQPRGPTPTLPSSRRSCLVSCCGRRHCVYHTDSFDRAVERCVNFLGDADSTGSMVGQMAGAIYGAQAIDPRLIANLQRWDRKGLVALRAALLFAAEATE